MTSPLRTRRGKLIAAGAAVVAVLAVGGPFVYTNVIAGDVPAPLAAGPSEAASQAATGSRSGSADGSAAASGGATAQAGADDGRWRATDASQAGYRVKEILLGQDHEAVGRTSAVTGEVTVQGAKVTKGGFTVDLTTVRSDQDRRDKQFHNRIMDTAAHPTAKFTLTGPIDISSLTAGSGTVPATGNLTLRGTTHPVTVDLKVQRSGANIQVSGSIPVVFADWDIPNPSFGPVSTDDHGQIEFALVLARG